MSEGDGPFLGKGEFMLALYREAGLPLPRSGEAPQPSARVAYFRRRRRESKEGGVCQVCRRREAVPGRTSCGACAEARDEQYERAKRLGTCPSCGEPAAPGRVRCRACLAKAVATNTRLRRERRGAA